MINLPEYIEFSADPSASIGEFLKKNQPDAVAILVDENTRKNCLTLLDFPEFQIIEIESGEANKTLETCQLIWEKLTTGGFSRKSLLINLGGGVIGDMGGFVASTYKRGIPFINVPTTLLSQVDASIGGKQGVDFHGLKNHIGVFREPNKVIIHSPFLKTLPFDQLRSGFAEVLKHGLIWDKKYFQKTSTLSDINGQDWLEIIQRSVEIKQEIVEQDPLESGLRKILNFGHTLGHAVETWHLSEGHPILHGEAIAIGMIMEAYLSRKLELISESQFTMIMDTCLKFFGHISSVPRSEQLIPLLMQDKKNSAGKINYSLIDNIGHCKYDVTVSISLMTEAIDHYRKLDE
ncbi:aroB [Symbiodinium microadriaticum]|nr:aroB [Symbiodinium microadriaticum]